MRKPSHARTKALRAGAQTLVDMMQSLEDVAEGDYRDFYDALGVEDGTISTASGVVNYRVLCEIVAESMHQNLVNATSADHREGFLRALTDVLYAVAGRGIPDLEADSLLNFSARSFALPSLAQAAISKAAGTP